MRRFLHVLLAGALLLMPTHGLWGEETTQGKAEDFPDTTELGLMSRAPLAPLMIHSTDAPWRQALREEFARAPEQPGESLEVPTMILALVAESRGEAIVSWDPESRSLTLVLREQEPAELLARVTTKAGHVIAAMGTPRGDMVLHDLRPKTPTWISPRQKPVTYALAMPREGLLLVTTDQTMALGALRGDPPAMSAAHLESPWGKASDETGSKDFRVLLLSEPGPLAHRGGSLAPVLGRMVMQPGPWTGVGSVEHDAIVLHLRSASESVRALAGWMDGTFPHATDSMEALLPRHVITWSTIHAGSGDRLVEGWLAAVGEALFEGDKERLELARRRLESESGYSLRHHLVPALTGRMMVAQLQQEEEEDSGVAVWIEATDAPRLLREVSTLCTRLGMEVGVLRLPGRRIHRIVLGEGEEMFFLALQGDSLVASTSDRTLDRVLTANAAPPWEQPETPARGIRMRWPIAPDHPRMELEVRTAPEEDGSLVAIFTIMMSLADLFHDQ